MAIISTGNQQRGKARTSPVAVLIFTIGNQQRGKARTSRAALAIIKITDEHARQFALPL